MRNYKYFVRWTILFGWLFLTAFACQARQGNPVRSYKFVVGNAQGYNPYVGYKNFYLLTLMEQIPELKKVILQDKVLRTMLEAKKKSASGALKNCAKNIGCYIGAIKFHDNEIVSISRRLGELYDGHQIFNQAVVSHLLPSGCYGLYAKLTKKDLLIKAWEQDAKSVNHIIDVYAAGKAANYPKIDSMTFNIDHREFPDLIASNLLVNIPTDRTLFFEPTMGFAMGALELNDREDAADYEPMEKGINQKAVDKIKRTKFEKFRYSMILIPGAGLEEKEIGLSAGGKLRCRIAVRQYRKGIAPFIMVSGGRVRPYKTLYSESFEMRKFLINKLHVPESSIILEPHARHTTTNFRNCARLIFRYGMPMNKAALVSTTEETIQYITSSLLDRCTRELGYHPYRIGKVISANEFEFFPNILSLQIDFDEPLDP